jgi:hypothetical protein
LGLYSKLRDTVTEAAIFGVAPIATSVTGFLLTFVYAKYFAPADLGQLALLLGTEAFATQILGLGMTQAFFRSYFDDDAVERRRFRRIRGGSESHHQCLRDQHIQCGNDRHVPQACSRFPTSASSSS